MVLGVPALCCRYTAMGRGQAGVLFLRPCAPIAAHMTQLASSNRLLQFPYHDAEQDFFDWYAALTGTGIGTGCHHESSSERWPCVDE